ncbi:hypothetical protein [Paraflavitalea speifideaquila]|uniref:hypothetical protein n=1 Tax=Paraflavitalea speifideaquila TaxID=3076558 RepID=UPI0028EDA0D5|nr:hypothetical protein [Paraflavitalea speifideiaquila]
MVAVLTCTCCRDKEDRSWGAYKADAASTSYSAHDQINLENVTKLQVAWTFTRMMQQKDPVSMAASVIRSS